MCLSTLPFDSTIKAGLRIEGDPRVPLLSLPCFKDQAKDLKADRFLSTSAVRQSRRAYPRTSVITQTDLTQLLLASPEGQSACVPSVPRARADL